MLTMLTVYLKESSQIEPQEQNPEKVIKQGESRQDLASPEGAG